MSSQEIRKNPHISDLKLFLLFSFLDVILGLILHFTFHNFIIDIIFLSILLPISAFFKIKYLILKPKEIRGSFKEKKISHCLYHLEEKIITHCRTCGNPICEQCQTFNTKMSDYYKHNFRLNHKLFDQSICMDCILKRLRLTTKGLLIISLITFGWSVFMLIWSYYHIHYFFNISNLMGILILILSLISFYLIFLINGEKEKLSTHFFKGKIEN